MQSRVLERVRDERLAVLAVWVPIRASDVAARVSAAARRLPDPRVRHFWDAAGEAPRVFARVLGLRVRRRAWDVYLFYVPGQRWAEAPRVWMHQLDREPGTWLDGRQLADEVQRVR